MTDQNPATPAQAASPGKPEQVENRPSAAPANPAGQQDHQGGGQDEKVSISLEEYRNLQRDHARVLSFNKRREFTRSRNNPEPQTTNDDSGSDPELMETLRKEQEAREAAERKAMRFEIAGKVRDILDKTEYAALPASTKALILKNPAMLSDADSVEEAMLDIEDFVREQVAGLTIPNNQPRQPQLGSDSRSAPAASHETPPQISATTPAPANAEGLEDTSKLTGPARSRAVLRNKFKQARGVNV